MVLHQNLEGGLLIKPQFLSGALNEHYQANPLEGGANFVHHTSANQTGRFTTKTQFVHFKYDPLNLKHSDAPEQPFIELLEPTDTYQQPSEEALTAARLPKHAVWKIYSCATAPSGKQWFNLAVLGLPLRVINYMPLILKAVMNHTKYQSSPTITQLSKQPL